MPRISAYKWSCAVIAVIFVAACEGGGSARSTAPGTSTPGAHVRAGTSAGTDGTARPTAASCPVGPGTTPIAGVHATSLPCLTGPPKAVSVAAVHGKPEVINFWASWCDPCRREAAVIEGAHRRYGDRITFLGVDSRDDRRAALRFITESGATYPHVFDKTGVFALQLGITVMPYTLVVDASGRIVERHPGELTSEHLRSALSHAGVDTGPGR